MRHYFLSGILKAPQSRHHSYRSANFGWDNSRSNNYTQRQNMNCFPNSVLWYSCNTFCTHDLSFTHVYIYTGNKISIWSDIPAIILFGLKKIKNVAQWERVHMTCMCVCVCLRVRVCVCVLGGERSWVFTSTALVVVWMARYLTSYSDYLTSFCFCEPLLPPFTSYRCHTSAITGYSFVRSVHSWRQDSHVSAGMSATS